MIKTTPLDLTPTSPLQWLTPTWESRQLPLTHTWTGRHLPRRPLLLQVTWELTLPVTVVAPPSPFGRSSLVDFAGQHTSFVFSVSQREAEKICVGQTSPSAFLQGYVPYVLYVMPTVIAPPLVSNPAVYWNRKSIYPISVSHNPCLKDSNR